MAETPAEYNAKIIAEFRANAGRAGGPWENIPLLLLHHTGAKSATAHVNPVAYLPDHSRYFIWAANGGALKHPASYHNIKAHPITRIEVGDETVDVMADEITGAERDRLYAKSNRSLSTTRRGREQDRPPHSHRGPQARSTA
jgi:deazaflavin-dependent oxidoreductase (nitroreductase family)